MEQNFLLRSPELVIKVIQVLKVHKDAGVLGGDGATGAQIQMELVHKVLIGHQGYKVHRHT